MEEFYQPTPDDAHLKLPVQEIQMSQNMKGASSQNLEVLAS